MPNTPTHGIPICQVVTSQEGWRCGRKMHEKIPGSDMWYCSEHGNMRPPRLIGVKDPDHIEQDPED